MITILFVVVVDTHIYTLAFKVVGAEIDSKSTGMSLETDISCH